MKIIKFVPRKKEGDEPPRPAPETPAKVIDIEDYLPPFWDPPEYIARLKCNSCNTEFSRDQKTFPEGLVECPHCKETSGEMTGPHIPRELFACPDCGGVTFCLMPDGGAFCMGCTALLYDKGTYQD